MSNRLNPKIVKRLDKVNPNITITLLLSDKTPIHKTLFKMNYNDKKRSS